MAFLYTESLDDTPTLENSTAVHAGLDVDATATEAPSNSTGVAKLNSGSAAIQFVPSKDTSSKASTDNSDIPVASSGREDEFSSEGSSNTGELRKPDEATKAVPDFVGDGEAQIPLDTAQETENFVADTLPDTFNDPVKRLVSQEGGGIESSEIEPKVQETNEKEIEAKLESDRVHSSSQPEPKIMIDSSFLKILPKIKPKASTTNSKDENGDISETEFSFPGLEQSQSSGVSSKSVGEAVAVDKAYFFQTTHRALRGNSFSQGENSVVAVERGGNEQKILRFPYKIMPYDWIISAPQPEYPENCVSEAREKETVTMRFHVDRRGRAPKPIVTSTSNPCFASAARSALRDMQFKVRAAPGYAYGGSEFLTSIVFEKPSIIVEK